MKAIYICLILLLSCTNKPKVLPAVEPEKSIAVELPEIVISAVLSSEIMSRDSGKIVDADFLKRCVKEHTKSYFNFYCNDFLWEYHLSIINSRLIYFIANGTSVENRELFSITDGKVTKIDDPLPEMLTYSKIAQLLNKKFPRSKYTQVKLEMIAHSHYRTKLPKNDGENIIILSGELGHDSEHAYKPIAEVKWDGKSFKIIE